MLAWSEYAFLKCLTIVRFDIDFIMITFDSVKQTCCICLIEINNYRWLISQSLYNLQLKQHVSCPSCLEVLCRTYQDNRNLSAGFLGVYITN